MRIHGFCIIYQLIVFYSVSQSASGKTLFTGDDKQSDVGVYVPVLRHVEKTAMYHTASNRDAEEEDDQIPGGSLKIPKINAQGTQCYDVASSKRAAEEDVLPSKVYKHKNRRSPYGIVYNQGKPIGILEPISRIYEYQDFQAQHNHETDNESKSQIVPVKRQIGTEEASSNIASENSKYASLLTNFKIGNRLDMKQQEFEEDSGYEKSQKKRDLQSMSPTPASDKTDTTLKSKRSIQNSDNNLDAIENNLKSIMNDLGLINNDDKISKREVGEDEDLDSGLNKIGLTKELHSEVRDKKENCPGKTGPTNGEAKQLRKGSESSLPGEEVNVEGDFQNKKAKKARIADFRFDGESFVRKKRQQGKNTENGDIIKGLESSGELTVSGNKSPLASSETENKHKAPKAEKDEKREKNVEDAEYEKRLQRNIQNKISEIKEEVKREISAAEKNAKEAKRDTNQDKKKRDEKHNKKEGKDRKKRNLLDKESKEIQPNVKIDGGLEPHIRKRRSTDEYEPEEKAAENRVTWSEIKDERVNKREDADFNKMPAPASHDAFDFDYRKKRSAIADVTQIVANVSGVSKKKRETAETSKEEPKDEKRIIKISKTSKENSKRDMKDDKGEVDSRGENAVKDYKRDVDVSKSKNIEEDKLGFQGAQNQNVVRAADTATHALVTRDLDIKNANVAQQSDKSKKVGPSMNERTSLNRLVSDSTSLTDSLKSERGARSGDQGPHVEVELHTGKDENLQSKRDDKKDEDEKEKSPEEITNKLIADGKPESSEKKRSIKMYTEHDDHDDADQREEKINKASSVKLQENTDEKASDSGLKVGEDAADVKIADEKGGSKKRSNFDENKPLEKSAELAPTSEESKDSKLDVIRMERKSEPNLSLEEMQQLDSENNNKRKRRQADYFYYGREKRDFQEQPNNMRFRNYRGDEDEADDESDEFDDDNFDDRTANLIRKRNTDHSENGNYNDFDEDYEPISSNDERHSRINKRNTMLHKYVSDMNSDVYDSPNYLYGGQKRKKRQVIEDLAAIHSGGPMLRHLAAAKERNNVQKPINAGFRRKRLEKLTQKQQQGKDQTIAGLSESDIFGGLPQSYEGELSRFKRVKRGNAVAKTS